MISKLVILIAVLLLPSSVSDLLAQDKHEHDHTSEQKIQEKYDHDDQDHANKNELGSYYGHSESDDQAADHGEHGDELTVELTPEAIELTGLTISQVKRGSIGSTIELPGEIGFNEDRLAHIAPRFAGIAMQANYRAGDYVEEGKVVAIVESNESMNSYSITAPISGWVISRHITPGEYVSEENSIYDIADLSTVWVNLAVYPRDANRIKKGQIAEIKAVGSVNAATGSIEYVTPIMDLRTRSATARITLSNPDNIWRPGTFVQASITTEAGNESFIVEKNAVQYLDGQRVIFVVDGPDRFTPVEVITGDSDANFVQIRGNISEGTEYVSTGAFELKAKIVTSNLDAHAGHGH